MSVTKNDHPVLYFFLMSIWYPFNRWLKRTTYSITSIRVTTVDTLLRGKECEAVCERIKETQWINEDYKFILKPLVKFFWEGGNFTDIRMAIYNNHLNDYADYIKLTEKLKEQNEELLRQNKILRDSYKILSKDPIELTTEEPKEFKGDHHL